MLSRTLSALAVASVPLFAACSDAANPSAPPPGPVPPAGEWRAAALLGEALPRVIYHFDPDETYGYPASVHLVVDSALLTLGEDGRYLHRIWVSEWEGALGGPPLTLRHRWALGDHGGWTGSGDAIRLDSWYLQNLAMDGELGTGDTLLLNHGLTHGDPQAPFTYLRRAVPGG